MNETSQQWLAEQWLVSAGVIPESAIDTLLLYAYSQKGVYHKGVVLEIDRDDANNGKNPKVTYKIKLEPGALLKWKALNKVQQTIKNPTLKKAAFLALAKAGAPYGIEENIKVLAKEYLPPQYQVEVHVIE